MKKFVISIVAFILCIAYIYAFLMTGVWYKDTFLYEKDGIFIGSDKNGEYTVAVNKFENGAQVDFSLNGKKYFYEVVNNETTKTEIYENGKKVFDGKVLDIDGIYILTDDSGKNYGTEIVADCENPTQDDLMPSLNEIYAFSRGKVERRGNILPCIVLIFVLIFLLTDIKFPDLFFLTRHGFDVDGGEPSEWYRFKQQVGRIILGLVTVICVVLTFTIH